METHTSGDWVRGIIKRIGLRGSFVEDVGGHVARRIWCLWDEENWKVGLSPSCAYESPTMEEFCSLDSNGRLCCTSSCLEAGFMG